ncbi:hypothetical protein [Emcibacter nanhaiensis]|uniref:Uncharacterized protein n=1 Tax=Emcibacter nanhaiensis TaxID=1505037 RepID=A0A501PPS5_9PROT|nr:hypothetical protein [Emcibacter nanhaiensis]TPD61964.1 hypothetical protein FIV46_07100 [Emcibacter nanhaiensis]
MPFKEDNSNADKLRIELDEALTRLERAALDVRAKGKRDGGESGAEAEDRMNRLEAENRQLRDAVTKLKQQYEILEMEHQELQERAESADRELDDTLRQLDRLIEAETIH